MSSTFAISSPLCVVLSKAKLLFRLDNTEFASSDYDERNSPLGYDDMPEKYKWDSSFSLEGMKAAIAQINRREKDWIEDDTSLEFLG